MAEYYGVELYEHQRKAVAELDNGKILCGDVGAGKTITSLAYYIERETPRDIYVITTAKKRDSGDWHDDAQALHIYPDERGEHGVLTVDSWNQIDKYVDVEGAFFIFDEQRIVGNGKWVNSFLRIAKRNRWILLSATPGDTWLDYIPVFLANGFYRTRTEFKREHVVYNHHARFPKVDRYVGVSKLVRLKNSILVDMPFERHTVRHPHTVRCRYDEDLFRKVWRDRWHVYENRPLRDVAELFSVARKVVNSDESRLDALKDLLATHPRLIVFYNFDYELEMLRRMLNSPESVSPWSMHAERSHSTTLDESSVTKPQMRNGTPQGGQIPIPVDTGRSKSSSSSSACRAAGQEENYRSGVKPISISTTTTISGSTEHTPESGGTQLRDSGSCPTLEGCCHLDQTNRSVGTQVGGTERHPNPSSQIRASSERSVRTTTFESGSTSATADSSSHPSGQQSVQIAEWNGHKHEPIPTTDSWVYLVQYTAGSEGWNCVSTNTVVMFSLTYSYKQWHQAHGRIDRLNTLYTDLHYYYLLSDSIIDKAVLKTLNEKKSFNEKNFAKSAHLGG